MSLKRQLADSISAMIFSASGNSQWLPIGVLPWRKHTSYFEKLSSAILHLLNEDAIRWDEKAGLQRDASISAKVEFRYLAGRLSPARPSGAAKICFISRQTTTTT
jgi:hypothetical protein